MKRLQPRQVRTLVAEILETVPAARTSDRELLYHVFMRSWLPVSRCRFMRLPNLGHVTNIKREILRDGWVSWFRRRRVRSIHRSLVERVFRWFVS